VNEIGHMKLDCIRFGYIAVGSKCTFEVLTSGTGNCCLLGCDALSRRLSLVVVVTSNVSKGPFSGLAFCPDLEAAETPCSQLPGYMAFHHRRQKC